MKQTNPSTTFRTTVSLVILGLNESFVRLNELMTLFLYKKDICFEKQISFDN
jgi:hypothetical protein